MRRASLAITAALLAACGGGSLETPARECRASNEAIDYYVMQIAGRVSNQTKASYALRRHERAMVSFALASDGSASDFRVDRSPRAEAAAEILRAAQNAAPFPRPPFEPSACLHGGRAALEVISFGGCDEDRTSEYLDLLVTRIQEAVNHAGIQTEGEPDQVGLRIQVSREGAATVAVVNAPTPEIGERVAAIARGLAPYATPHESIVECVVDDPSFVWVGLPGLTREPVPIHSPGETREPVLIRTR
jgi:hypothetical protein